MLKKRSKSMCTSNLVEFPFMVAGIHALIHSLVKIHLWAIGLHRFNFGNDIY